MTLGVKQSSISDRHGGGGGKRVLACELLGSVLVVPGVDPLWSHVGRVCRRLCNYGVSMTY